MDNRMAIIITSCDSYCDLWDPFFNLMDKYWENCKYKVYLNTEKKRYNKQFSNFEVHSLNILEGRRQEKTAWSQRMLDVLDRISEEYVFILVDDFFLRENVQTELIEKILDKMDLDRSIGQIQLFGTRTNCDKRIKNIQKESIKMEEIGNDKAKVCFVPTIWRKAVLKRWLRPWETIWAFESCGASRAKRWKYPEKVFRVYSPAIFNYLWEKGCYCVVNGKWMVHPLLVELFDRNGIFIDFSLRGTITMDEWKSVDTKAIMKRYTLMQVTKKTLNRCRSFF